MESKSPRNWELNLKPEDFQNSCILLQKFSELPTWEINVIKDICNAIIDPRMDGLN